MMYEGRTQKGSPIEFFDDACHRKRLAAAGNAQKNLRGKPVTHAFDEFVNGLRLIAARRKRGN